MVFFFLMFMFLNILIFYSIYVIIMIIFKGYINLVYFLDWVRLVNRLMIFRIKRII